MQATALRLSGEFSLDALTFDSMDLPELGPLDVLVGVRAVSLNQRDLMLVKGSYDPNVSKPRVLCSDGAGDVLAVGSAVTSLKPGDRVVAGFFRDWVDGALTHQASSTALGGALDGILTTHTVLPEHALVKVPAEMTFEEAATLPCAGVTAWHALVSLANTGKDDTVLILGTGGVGVFALQIAKLRGARVIVTSSSDDKLSRAKAMGADETINYRTTPDWDKCVRELTDKRGATHVIETGGAATLPLSLRSAALNGRISIIGLISGVEQPIDLRQIIGRALTIQGIYVGSQAMLRQLAEMFSTYSIHPVIDQRFPFEQSVAALRALQTAEHFGKIVITTA